MRSDIPVRSHALSRFTLAFLGLAVAVFAWGLQYKLSLYDPPQSISHKIPAAKLLSRNETEHTAAAEGIQLSAAGHAPAWGAIAFLACVFISFCSEVSLLALAYSEVNRPWLNRLLASLDRFSFRPPPAFA